MNSHVVMSAKGGDRQACASPSQRWCVAPVKFYRRSSPAVLHRGPAASSCSDCTTTGDLHFGPAAGFAKSPIDLAECARWTNRYCWLV